MIQPFQIFRKDYLGRLLKLNKIYLISQSYHRARNIPGKTDILLTDYDDIGLAKIHFAAIKEDKFAAILQLQNDAHMHKLDEMLEDESPYKLYWSVVDDKKKFKEKISKNYKEKIRRYILENTDWKVALHEVITPHVQVVFGELYVTLKRNAQEIRVRFDEIEKA